MDHYFLSNPFEKTLLSTSTEIYTDVETLEHALNYRLLQSIVAFAPGVSCLSTEFDVWNLIVCQNERLLLPSGLIVSCSFVLFINTNEVRMAANTSIALIRCCFG